MDRPQQFSLVTCVDDVEPLLLSASATVKAIEGVGNHLFLGSGSGAVVSIALFDESQSSERIFVQNTVDLPEGQPVVQLIASAMLNRLLALSDGSVYVMTLDGLKLLGQPRLRSVSCMALNKDPDSNGTGTVSMAVGLRRRQIAVCEVQIDRINEGLELDTDDVPVTLAFEGRCICYGTASHYYIVDVQKRTTRPLFPVKNDDAPPVVRRISKNEFILTGMHNLAMFVTSEGVSNRPPFSWDDGSPVDAAFRYPYVIVLSPNYLWIFSVEDQQLRQKLPCNDGQRLCVCDGDIFVATKRSLFQVKPTHAANVVGVDTEAAAIATDNSADNRRVPKVEKKEEYVPRLPKIQARPKEWNETISPLFQSRCKIESVIIGASLAQSRLQDATNEEKKITGVKFQISENQRCAACDQLFLEPDCIRYPNGRLIHPYCMRHPNLCPATQEAFCSPKPQ